MKQTIELNNEDIRHLIAKEFHVEEDQVYVSLRSVWRGHGIYEHEEYEVFATVNR